MNLIIFILITTIILKSKVELKRFSSSFTIGFASHGRYDLLRLSINSAVNKYPNAQIIVVDDGAVNYSSKFIDVKYIKVPFDSGVSMVRNKIVEKTKTKYIFMTDEDIMFTKHSDLFMMKRKLDEGYPIVTANLNDRAAYDATYTLLSNYTEICNTKKTSNECFESDRGLVILATTKEFMSNVKWNEKFKLAEHEPYFKYVKEYTVDNSMKSVLICPQIKFHHNLDSNNEQYNLDRERSNTWVDTNYVDIVKSCDETNKRLIFQHIPKTGGVSFYKEMRKFGISFTNRSPGNNEVCFGYRNHEYTMIRSPIKHVLSQYVMCRYSDYGKTTRAKQLWDKNDSMYEGFDKWVSWFVKNKNNDYKGCYNPYNLQTRALSCKHKKPHDHTRRDFYNSTYALENLQSLKYGFGISDEYSKSVCLFLHKFGRRIPKWCKCGNSKPKHVHMNHNVPKHSVEDIPAKTLSKVKKLVGHDQDLYDKAYELFKRETDNLGIFC